MAGTFLTAAWRKLIMAQYAVEPATLAPYLPEGVELDLFDGACFVSMVGFLFDDVRLKGMPIPFHTRFPEVNLRFYVRRVERDGTVRRGVVFVREYVPKPAITIIANTIYEEPYATLPMRYAIRRTGDTLQAEYDWKHRGRWYSLGVQAAAQAEPIAPGSAEEFTTEHYWGFTKRTRGATSQYAVKHPSWVIYPVRQYRFAVDFARLYGARFAGLNGQEPDNILLAEGSAVSVDGGTRLA